MEFLLRRRGEVVSNREILEFFHGRLRPGSAGAKLDHSLADAGQVGAAQGVVREPRPTVVGGPGLFGQREPPDLVRVIPLAREAVSRSGYRLMLISLEIWSGWLDLRYALLALVPLRSNPLEDARHRWQLTDDLGTDYELVGTTSGAGRTVHLHQLSFQPAPPPDARVLTLTLKDEEDTDIATAEIPLVDEPA